MNEHMLFTLNFLENYSKITFCQLQCRELSVLIPLTCVFSPESHSHTLQGRNVRRKKFGNLSSILCLIHHVSSNLSSDIASAAWQLDQVLRALCCGVSTCIDKATYCPNYNKLLLRLMQRWEISLHISLKQFPKHLHYINLNLYVVFV